MKNIHLQLRNLIGQIESAMIQVLFFLKKIIKKSNNVGVERGVATRRAQTVQCGL